MPKKLRYIFEYDGYCLWANNDEALDQFGYCVHNKDLPLSNNTIQLLDALGDEFHTSLNWDDPAGPSPWTEEHREDFFNRATKAYEILVNELGPDFEVVNDLRK